MYLVSKRPLKDETNKRQEHKVKVSGCNSHQEVTTSFHSLVGERQFQTRQASTTVTDLALDNWN